MSAVCAIKCRRRGDDVVGDHVGRRRSSGVGAMAVVDGSCLIQARRRVLAKLLSSLSLGSSATTSSVCENLYVL